METISAINDAETRARYAGPAVRAFLNLAKAWKLSQTEQIDLLGASVTRQTLGNWAVRPPAMLSADELMRRGIPSLEKTRAYVDGVTGGPPSREDYPPPPREAD